MQDFGTKADNSPPPGGQLSAAEFNNLATENENAVARSGQTLSGASDTQLARSLFLHGVKSESFQDSGAANAYVATPVSGTNGVLLPPDYANMDGAVIVFKAAHRHSISARLPGHYSEPRQLLTRPEPLLLLAPSLAPTTYSFAMTRQSARDHGFFCRGLFVAPDFQGLPRTVPLSFQLGSRQSMFQHALVAVAVEVAAATTPVTRLAVAGAEAAQGSR